VLAFPAALKIYLAVEPVDMRKSFNGLWVVASEKLNEDPKNGAVFAFTNKKRNRLKLLYFDGTGVWVLAKRLEQGRFSWPMHRTGVKLSITPESLTMIFSGIELQKGLRKAWYER
jgi:transposase